MRFNQFSYQPTTSSQQFEELEGLGLKLSPQLSLKRQFEDFIRWSFFTYSNTDYALSTLAADKETDLVTFFQSDRELTAEIFYTVVFQLLGFSYLVDFENANLEDANMQAANLQDSNMQVANLKNAILQGANLERVNLQYATFNWSQLKNNNTQLAGAKITVYDFIENIYPDWKKENVPNASPKEWENYRNKYEWRPVFSSDNDSFFVLEYGSHYYNGEREYLLQPYILKAEYIKRAIPNEIDLFWRVGGAQYEGRVFFKWDKMDKILKEKGKTKNDIRFHINKDNKIEVFLNDEPLEAESIRVYGDSNIKFQI